jgi:hypothetical protein
MKPLLLQFTFPVLINGKRIFGAAGDSVIARRA